MEEAGGAAGWSNTLLPALVVALLTAAGAAVVPEGAAVQITGVTSRELLFVVTGAHWVKIEPGFSEVGNWNAVGAT